MAAILAGLCRAVLPVVRAQELLAYAVVLWAMALHPAMYGVVRQRQSGAGAGGWVVPAC